MKQKTKNLTLCACLTAVLCACAQIAVPMPSGVAFTLQTFAAALIGFVLGAKGGGVCAAVYLILGGTGVPVFSHFSGGMGALVGPTGGFLWCLPVFCGLCGLTLYVNRKAYKILILLSALTVLHLCGILWFSRLSANGFLASALAVSFIYIPKDIISIALAHTVAKRVRKFIKGSV